MTPAMARAIAKERYCQTCGALLVRKTRPNGTPEQAGNFLARRFCNQACVAVLRPAISRHSHSWGAGA